MRRICASRVLGAALVIAASGETPARPNPVSEPVPEPVVPIEREIAPGEIHTFPIELAAGRRLRILVEQKGVQVVLAVTGPAGAELLAVRGPRGRHGPQRLVLATATAGTYRAEVRARTRGRYQITVEQLPPAAATGGAAAERAAAERAETAAGELNRRGTAEARAEAVARYREALAHWRTAGMRREEAWALYSLGVLHEKLDVPQGLEFLHQALPLLHDDGDGNGEAATLNMIGRLHRLQGENPRAVELYRRALALREAAADRCGQAETLSNLAMISQRDAPREALEHFDRALFLCGEADDPGLAAIMLVNVGGAYDILGELDEALRYFARALEPLRSLDKRRSEALTLNNMGVAHRALGEYRQTFERYHSALGILREVGDRRGQATILNNLGFTYLKLGEPRRALTYLRQALPLRREIGDRHGEGATLNNLGQALAQIGNPGQALAFYRRALALWREIDDRRGEGSTLHRIGSVHADLGELAKARLAFAQALDLRREGNPVRQAETLRHVASVELALGEPREAREHLRRALELHRRVKDLVGEAATLLVLARAERRLGELTNARSLLESALELIESQRIRISSPDLRASFLAAQRDAYEAAIDLSMELHQLEPGKGHDREALEVSERARARSLLELLGEAGAELRRGVDPELLARRKALRRRLSTKAERRRDLLSRDRAARATAMEGELETILAQLEQLEVDIRRRSPSYAALTRPLPLRATELRQLLDADTILLEYALGEERSFLWTVTSERIESFPLPARQEIETAARELYRLWSTLDIRGQRAEAEAAAALGRMLLAPAGERLEGVTRLVIVTDGALHFVPFAALPAPVPGKSVVEPLVSRYEILTLPSASVLALQRRTFGGRTPAPGRLAVVADPIFSRHDSRIASHRPDDPPAPSPPPALPPQEPPHRGPAATATAPESGLARLRWSRHEAEAIAALVPESRIFLDSRASRAMVAGGGLEGYRIVHFATHGVLDSRHPELSGLFFSLFDQAGGPVDGFLPAHEIYDLTLAAELVVLSGCQTALGKEIRGEGLVGLTRGFMYAGAARVVASLWRIQDKATAELMRRFYRAHLLDGESPAAALRTAQLAMWRETGWKDPYYWAAFVLQGDWRQ